MEQNKLMQLSPERPLIQNLITGITTTGSVEVAKIDKFAIGLELKKYKDGNKINYPALFDIPKDQRITAMAVKDLGGTIKIITVALTLALETMNLKRGMTAFQILDLAEAIVDESDNDSLAIEDLMLFLQKLTRGEYPEMFEGIDQVKFMTRFNHYRDERWNAGIEIRDKKNEDFKRLGDDNYFERRNPKDTTAFGDMMEHYKTKAQIKRDEQRERKYDQ
jgi:hypothetical protein